MRGLILAGGLGSRLSPSTLAVCKPLISVYHKPMIYYPLSVLLLAGIKDILIISTAYETPLFQQLLGGGSKWGINLSYAVQPTPQGLAQAVILGAEFVGNQSSALILGDNIFYGDCLIHSVQNAAALKKGAHIFAYSIDDPEKYEEKYEEKYGMVVFDESGKACDLQEKPQNPQSAYAVTGLYFYDSSVAQRARSLTFSARSERGITALNKTYLDDGMLQVNVLTHGTSWFDTGTCDSLLDAEKFIETVEKRQGLKVCCPEEICWRKGYIDDCQLEHLAAEMKGEGMKMNDYGKHLKGLLPGTDDPFQALYVASDFKP